ncbi:MAG: carbohydrate kinase family protein [Patescibacteria group bacterium]|nr:carbohydrate kinase family protein [Patescibacteria group bacterium]
MYQVISIGSALVDIFIHSKDFTSEDTDNGRMLCQSYGDKLKVDHFNVYTGGGASNTAVGFARMGFRAGIIAETGRDHFSSLVMTDLSSNDVGTQLIIKEKKEQTGGSVILVGVDGERTVLVHRGASSMLDPYDIPSYRLIQAEWVHLTSIAGRIKALEKIFKVVSKQNHLKLSWNPGKAELKFLAEGRVSFDQIPCQVLFVNQQEWEMIGKVQDEAIKSCAQVIITNGKKGGQLFVAGKDKGKFPSSRHEAVDTTGAGDAFACGYVSGQIMKKSPLDSIKIGVKNAGSVVGHYGAKAGLLRKNQLH